MKVLTTEYDNVPFWSPLGDRILFTRKFNGDWDIYTIRPDGSDLQQLTKTPGNDAHAVWTDDGKHVMWSSARFGFKDEAVVYDDVPQPYAQIFINERGWYRADPIDGYALGRGHAAVAAENEVVAQGR